MTGWRYIFRLKEHEGKYDGVTSFGETFVLADENGAPLHPAMLYMAPRGAKECRELEETAVCGLLPYPWRQGKLTF